MLLNVMIAAFAAGGLFLVLRALMDAIILPRPEKAVHIYYIRGGSAEAEHTIRGCLHLRDNRGMRGMLLFADDGLTPEGQTAAELLLRGEPDAALCSAAQICEYIGRENDGLGAGTDQRRDCRGAFSESGKRICRH
ncbi:MAG: hypothetical protein IJJ99_07690 [Oscillospiraceae bacterium]|nr:hypothetical protein [Oscillospiraceae bacterium]